MKVCQIDIYFQIFLEQQIVCQGSFNIIDVEREYSFCSTGSGVFIFKPSPYVGGKTCDVQISYFQEGEVVDEIVISVYINLTKHKWKRVKLGDFEVIYVCSRHEWDTENLTKREKKQRRKSLGQDVTGGRIYKIGYKSEDGT